MSCLEDFFDFYDFYDLNDFYDLLLTAYRSPFTAYRLPLTAECGTWDVLYFAYDPDN